MLSAFGSIKPAVAGTAPTGSCSQIKLTAWRNDYDYSCNDPATPHETTTAMGPDLNNCTYNLPVEQLHKVTIKASISVPGWRVVLAYQDTPEFAATFWEEQHPVNINWVIKPLRLPVVPTKK